MRIRIPLLHEFAFSRNAATDRLGHVVAAVGGAQDPWRSSRCDSDIARVEGWGAGGLAEGGPGLTLSADSQQRPVARPRKAGTCAAPAATKPRPAG